MEMMRRALRGTIGFTELEANKLPSKGGHRPALGPARFEGEGGVRAQL